MQEEDDSDNLDKDSQHVEYLSGVSHVEKDSEDVNRKQGKYDSLYRFDNDFLEVVARIFQVIRIQMRQSGGGYGRNDFGGCAEGVPEAFVLPVGILANVKLGYAEV